MSSDLVLPVGRPVQIFAAEHHNAVAHPWSYSAAPNAMAETGAESVRANTRI